MKIDNKIKFGMIFLIGFLLVVPIALAYMETNYYSGAGASLIDSSLYHSEKDVCAAGEDFLIQIAPFGCTPAVVRSDLLEEQNVPIFCQLAATKINPLIDVDAIESISFSGKYPKEVSGIGFHPARAALGVQGNLNSPILNNIGYVVVVLKKQPNESAMPEFVVGNLTAKIKYNIKNSFGIGKASFYLPEMTDSEFKNNKNQYSFWERRGYLRAESIDNQGAVVSVYDDARKIASVDLKKGTTSRKISLPTLDDCLAKFQLRLEGLENPDTRVKLNINGDIVEVGEKEWFLENRCKVRDIEKQGVTEKVMLNCKEDETSGLFSGSNTFNLRISPRVNLSICDKDGNNCATKDYGIGERIPYSDDKNKYVYLGFIGTVKDSGKEKDLYVRFVQTPFHGEILDDNMLSEVARFDKLSKQKGSIVAKLIEGGLKAEAVWVERFTKYLWKGTKISKTLKLGGFESQESVPSKSYLDYFYGNRISIVGFAEPKNVDFAGRKSFDASSCKIGSSIVINESNNFSYKFGEENLTQKGIPYLVNKLADNHWEDSTNLNNKLTDSEINKFFTEGKIIKYGDSCIVSSQSTASSNIKANYDDALKDYDTLVKSFSSEKTSSNSKINYGEQALYNKIKLGDYLEQKRTIIEWCNEFKERYSDSKLMTEVNTKCEDKARLASSSISSRDVSINGRIKQISFEGIYEPSEKDYSVDLVIENANKNSGSISVLKGGLVYFSDTEFIKLRKLDEDYAEFEVDVNEADAKEFFWKTNYLKIKAGDFSVVGKNNYKITVNKIHLKKSARVSVIPSIDNAGTETNFSFKIGIEKRNIKLSPEKTREKIALLNETIKKWEDKSEKLGKVVKGLKASCLSVGAFLTVKNFLINADGKAIARQQVMRGEGGWYEKCADAIGKKGELKDEGYKTINECLTKESDPIDKAVNKRYNGLKKQNEDIKKWQKEWNCKTTKFLTETHIDEDCFRGKFAEEVKKDLSSCTGDIEVAVGTKVNCSEIIKMIDKNSTSIEQMRRIQLNSRFDSKMARAQLEKDLKDVWVNNQEEAERERLADELKNKGLDLPVTSYGNKNAIVGTYSGGTISSSQIKGVPLNDKNKVKGKYPVEIITYNSQKYVVLLGGAGTKYVADKVYEYKGISKGVIEVGEERTDIASKFKSFIKYDSSAYKNKYKSSSSDPSKNSPLLKYYETEPYSGLPAIVPFDCTNGWYVVTQQVTGAFGGFRAYDDSGVVRNYYICNVGANGREENKGGDDICRMINKGTGQPYDVFPGLKSNEARTLVRNAEKAIEEASRKHKSGISGTVSIGNNCKVKIGSPAVDIPNMQCQDFMSPTDCQLMFNVCDPVICPPSRCDFGGAYPVKDVIQSGIVGSILLCAPNYREGIYIPICLTGLKAGIDGLLSVDNSYRDCLQESLDTGKMVGICDEIYSVHLCEFFWRQSLSLAKIIIPKMMEVALGQNVRGGGEYMSVASAWKNTGKSVDYFAQYYATTSSQAFKSRIVKSVGDAVCKNSISASYPDGGNILDSLTDPNSPPQFHGRFDEIPFTTVTNPPISHYKVYYHIYAGKESRAYFQVYLKADTESSYYQSISNKRYIASGYIATGGYASETKDFTAPSGYKQMCINVNGQEECGFKQVSTSYAVNYIKDKYMEEQAGKQDISSEKECISGSASAYSLLNPNLQSAGEELISPKIYNRGIIRICATESPGKGTDGNDGTYSSRWVQVGKCSSDGKIKCWQDQESVKNVIGDLNIEAKVLGKQSNNTLSILMKEGDYKSKDYIQNVINGLKGKSPEEIINEVNKIINKTFWNDQKANLHLKRGDSYGELAKGLYRLVKKDKTAESSVGNGDTEKKKTIGNTGESKTVSSGGCEKLIGEKILEIIKSNNIKDKYNIDDNRVEKDTGAKNFECLILQVAYQESHLRHCEEYKEGDCLYCDGDINEIIKSASDEKSYGVMQINTKVHKNVNVEVFSDNVLYGVKNVLISGYNSYKNGKYFAPLGKTYYGWEAALRSYNGWGSLGNDNYVEEVIGKRNRKIGGKEENVAEDVKKLFPELCGDETIGNENNVGEKNSSGIEIKKGYTTNESI